MERNHRRPRLSSGPAQGYGRGGSSPGFTAATRRLLREPDLMQRQEAFDVAAWRNARTPAPASASRSRQCCRAMDVAVLLRAAALPQWLQLCEAASTPTHLLVALVAPRTRCSRRWEFQAKMRSRARQISATAIYFIPNALPQAAFDEMLWACDLNAVRKTPDCAACG